jgi:hypothetical protein
MGIFKRVRSIRTTTEEDEMFEFIQRKAAPFTRTFTQTVIFCGRIVFKLLSTPGMVSEFVDVCQSLRCTTGNPEQMRIHFPPQDGTSFFPRIGGMR